MNETAKLMDAPVRAKVICQRFNLDIGDLLLSLGLPADLYDRPNRLITRQQRADLMATAIELVPGKNRLRRIVALAGDNALDLVGMSIRFVSNLGDALDLMERNPDLFTVADFEILRTTESRTVKSDDGKSGAGAARANMLMLMILVQELRKNTDVELAPRRVTVCFDCDGDAEGLAQHFGCEIIRGPRNSITFAEEDCALPFLAADQAMLAEMKIQLVRRHMALMPPASIAVAARAVIMDNISDKNLSVDLIAAELAIGRRTLQRRLKNEGWTFSQLVSEIRQELVWTLIRQGKKSKGEIAHEVGFRDTNTLYRAMTRWRLRANDS